MTDYTVTLNYKCNYGYVEYNEQNKTAIVALPINDAKAAVENFLTMALTLDVPQGDTIRDFVSRTLQPLDSLENFRLALTRLWGKTGVRVEWSIPPRMADDIAKEVLAEEHSVHIVQE